MKNIISQAGPEQTSGKIRINKYNDFTELSRGNIESLFGCTSKYLKMFDQGFSFFLSAFPGADRGLFQLQIIYDTNGYTFGTVTLGDDQIEKYIEFEKDDQEEQFDSELTTHEEYERDHPRGYFLGSTQG